MKNLRFGLIGLGYFGKNYLRLLQEIDGIELVAVAAKTKESLDECSSQIPKNATRTTDAKAILKNPSVDAVVIATPPATHAQFSVEALKNGKHALLEKPLADSLRNAKKIRDAAKKSKTVFMVGHQYVYNDYVKWLHDNISTLGKISQVAAEHLYNGPIRQDIGCLWDAGTHQLSMMQHLLNPGRIVSAKGKLVRMNKKGIDDFTAATIEFENGLSATMILTWLSPQKTRKLTLIGSEKTAVFDDVKENDKVTITDRHTGKQLAPKIAAKEPLRNEVEHFLHCILTGEKPMTDADSSYEITEWLEKISASLD